LETDRKPIRTSDGSYAFLDIIGTTCTLVITSSTYLEHLREIKLPEAGAEPPILTVSLLPNGAYSPPPAATGLVAAVCDDSGLPLANAQISAYIDDDMAVRGRLVEDIADGDNPCIRISPGNSKLMPGDAFVMRDRDGTATEWNVLVDRLSDPSMVSLERPFTRKWNRGTRLLPAVRTRTDNNGLVVLPFRGLLPTVCPVAVEIESGARKWTAAWMAEGGKVITLPTVRM
jgi:hypothetical protein